MISTVETGRKNSRPAGCEGLDPQREDFAQRARVGQRNADPKAWGKLGTVLNAALPEGVGWTTGVAGPAIRKDACRNVLVPEVTRFERLAKPAHSLP